MAEPGPADLAALVARFTAALHAAGLPVGPDRAERFTRAVTVVRPETTTHLRACAHATLALTHDHIAVIDAVFTAVFGGMLDPADHRGDRNHPPPEGTVPGEPSHPRGRPNQPDTVPPPVIAGAGTEAGTERTDDEGREVRVASVGSPAERLAEREFGALSPGELAALAALMSRLRIATPDRASRRSRSAAHGPRVDLRATLRRAHRTGGDPARLIRRRPRTRPRPLVALCDISGSMAPYARAMLQLLYAAATGRSEVFVFATRLTRLTPVLARGRPDPALAAAGATAPDWSGGTRIGAALRNFIDGYGRRGMARGAVVLIISDGWETGDPAELGRQMARLSRLAYRIVWVNPRTQSPRYQPKVGGMAAAWPYCDAVVSGHRIDALDALLDAVADPRRTRPPAPALS
jgi:uncharacterized protein